MAKSKSPGNWSITKNSMLMWDSSKLQATSGSRTLGAHAIWTRFCSNSIWSLASEHRFLTSISHHPMPYITHQTMNLREICCFSFKEYLRTCKNQRNHISFLEALWAPLSSMEHPWMWEFNKIRMSFIMSYVIKLNNWFQNRPKIKAQMLMLITSWRTQSVGRSAMRQSRWSRNIHILARGMKLFTQSPWTSRTRKRSQKPWICTSSRMCWKETTSTIANNTIAR